MENIIYQKSDYSCTLFYLNCVLDHAKKIEDLLEKSNEKFLNLTVEKDDLERNITQILQVKNSLIINQEKNLFALKDKLQHMKDNIENVTEEKQQLKNSLDLSDLNYKTLTTEHEKLMNRIKQAKFKLIETDAERICKNCKKIFSDEENFNWSCKVHTSQFSGEIWWCCGKKGDKAPGCKICKHDPSEDSENMIKDEENKSKKNFCSVFFTQACKKIGHGLNNCPNDPNAKTYHDISDEIERLAKINNQKSLKNVTRRDKEKNNECEVQENILSQVKLICTNTSSEHSEQEENLDKFFPDLMEIKSNTNFALDKVKFRQTKYKIISDIGDSPFMVRKFQIQRRTKKNEINNFSNVRISKLHQTIKSIEMS